MKFTKEEISLCKQVAEKYKKEIKYGSWGLVNKRIHLFIDIPTDKQAIKEEIIPLWTISDCLEFLRGKEWFARDLIEYGGEVGVTFLHQTVKEKKFITGDGKTPLEACLKAVLAVFKEEGK